MSGDDGIYAPKSPDLSSFYSAGPTPPAEQPAQTQQHWPLPHPQKPQSQVSPQQQPQTHFQQGPASTYFSAPPEGNAGSLSSFQQQQQQAHAPPQHHKPQLSTPPQTLAQARSPNFTENQPPLVTNFGGVGYSPQQSQLYSPYYSHAQPGLPGQPQSGPGYTAPSPQSSLSFHNQPWFTPNTAGISNSFEQYRPFDQIPPQHQQQYQQQQYQQQLHDPHSLAAYKAQYEALSTGQQLDASLLPQDNNNNNSGMPPKRAAASRTEPPPPAIEPSPVKTKFPTARIKRIMQADEEVGKVAQQTPIAVGKALEMFMVALVSKSADVAREKNSKRVSAQMLKQVVESDDQWDFLREIVSRVENTEEKKGGPSKSKSVAESESEEEAPPVEKKKRAVRRKKV